MAGIGHRIAAKIRYKITARHRRGDGIHSPYVFRQINLLFRVRHPHYALARLVQLRIHLGQRHKKCIGSLPSDRHLALMYRILADHPVSGYLLEVGDSAGLIAAYLAHLDKANGKVWACVPDEQTKKTAENTFALLRLTNGVAEVAESSDVLKNRLEQSGQVFAAAYVHLSQYGAADAEKIKEAVKKHLAEGAIVFVEGIHDSGDAERIWKRWAADETVSVGLDVFDFGILYTAKDLQRGYFKVRF